MLCTQHRYLISEELAALQSLHSAAIVLLPNITLTWIMARLNVRDISEMCRLLARSLMVLLRFSQAQLSHVARVNLVQMTVTHSTYSFILRSLARALNRICLCHLPDAHATLPTLYNFACDRLHQVK